MTFAKISLYFILKSKEGKERIINPTFNHTTEEIDLIC